MSNIMDGPSLGICDVHPGVHQFRNDPSPCIGWMDYEPFVKPDHEPMLPASGIGNVPADQCGECGEVHTSEPRMSPGDRPEAVSELDDEPSQMEILVTPDMLREIAEDLEREGDNFCRTLQTTTGEFIDLRNMSVECSACGDSLDVRDADDKMRCEPCHDADVTHDEQGNQITPV